MNDQILELWEEDLRKQRETCQLRLSQFFHFKWPAYVEAMEIQKMLKTLSKAKLKSLYQWQRFGA